MPTAASTRQPLPLPVVYTAVGILSGGRPHGERKTLTPAELSRAVQVATARRQEQGHLVPGTRRLTAAGIAWERSTRAAKPQLVQAAQAEFERLVTLTHASQPKEPRTAMPRATTSRAKTPLRAAAPPKGSPFAQHEQRAHRTTKANGAKMVGLTNEEKWILRVLPKKTRIFGILRSHAATGARSITFCWATKGGEVMTLPPGIAKKLGYRYNADKHANLFTGGGYSAMHEGVTALGILLYADGDAFSYQESYL